MSKIKREYLGMRWVERVFFKWHVWCVTWHLPMTLHIFSKARELKKILIWLGFLRKLMKQLNLTSRLYRFKTLTCVVKGISWYLSHTSFIFLKYLYLRSCTTLCYRYWGGGVRKGVGLTSQQDSEVFNERNHISQVSLSCTCLIQNTIVEDSSRNVSVE